MDVQVAFKNRELQINFLKNIILFSDLIWITVQRRLFIPAIGMRFSNICK